MEVDRVAAEADGAPIEAGGDPSERLYRPLAVACWMATSILLAITLLLTIREPGADDPSSPAVVFVPLLVAMCGLLVTVGALLALRVHRNPIGWMLCVSGLLLALAYAASAYMTFASASGSGDVPSWLIPVPALFQVGLVLAGLVILVFPGGSLGPGGGRVLVTILVGLAIGLVAGLFGPGLVEVGPTVPNPLGVDALAPWVAGLQAASNVLLVLGFVAAVVLLARSFRRARGEERKQLEWFAFASIWLAIALSLASLQVGLLSDVAWAMAFVGFAALPLAIAVAITKYHLYDIDRLVNRTLVYIPLVAILGGVFAGGVSVLERLFLSLTGRESDASVVIATLVVAGGFAPLKKSIETSVDRRFRPDPAGAAQSHGPQPAAVRDPDAPPDVAGVAVTTSTLPSSAVVVDDLLADPRMEALIRRIASQSAEDALRRQREAGATPES
jgi:hypothetical protein